FLELKRQKVLNEIALTDFSINLEVSHHGPTNLKRPLVFMELGSDENYWMNVKGAAAVARSIINVIRYFNKEKIDFTSLSSILPGGVGVGFGGPHYAATFDRVLTNSSIGFSHVVPKHEITSLTREVIKKAIERTMEPVSWFALDWKGLNRAQKDYLLPLLESFDIPVKRVKHLEKEYMLD
ncbi:MAG: D-aminoacyl-tRNA deacylase, partial [Promethearchaeota archaeon]